MLCRKINITCNEKRTLFMHLNKITVVKVEEVTYVREKEKGKKKINSPKGKLRHMFFCNISKIVDSVSYCFAFL